MPNSSGKSGNIFLGSIILLVLVTVFGFIGSGVISGLIFGYRNHFGIYRDRAFRNLEDFAERTPGGLTPVSCNAKDTDGNDYIGCTLAKLVESTGETDFTSVECSIRPNGGCELTDLEQLNGSGGLINLSPNNGGIQR